MMNKSKIKKKWSESFNCVKFSEDNDQNIIQNSIHSIRIRAFFASKMMILWIFLILVLLFAVYRLTKKDYPQIHVNMNGKVANIISHMKSLQTPYKPTPWLIGSHMQTMYGMRFRKKHLKYRREIFKFSDGGQCALDFYDPIEKQNQKLRCDNRNALESFDDQSDDEDRTPILMIIHTLAGGTREPCSNNLAEAARRKGYRAVIYNNRGCSGVPFTTKKYYNSQDDSDAIDAIKYLRNHYHPSYLFLTGFSLGAYMAALVDVDQGDLCDGIALISHSYNGLGSNKILNSGIAKKIYLPYMMQKVHHLASKNEYIAKTYPEALHSRTLDEYDQLYTCKEFGMESYHDYYDCHCLYKRIPNFKAPTFVLGADNDPFTSKTFMPIEEVEKSQYCTFVHVKEGGHVSFLTGMKAEKSYIDLVVLDFFDTIMRIHQCY